MSAQPLTVRLHHLGSCANEMEFRQLRYFVAAVDAGSMIAAANRMHVSQPALSRQISTLEAEFGVPLLIRSATGVTPTTAGKQLLLDARRILRLAGEARGTARAAHGGEVGHLRIGYFGTSVFTFIPQLLALLRQRHGGITVEIKRLAKAEQISAVRAGAIDIGFGRYYEPASDLTVHTIINEPLVAALAADEADETGSPIAIESLLLWPLLLFPAEGRPNLSDHILAALAAEGHVPTEVDLAEDATSALARIAYGGKAGLLPASAQALKMPEIVFRPISGLPFETPVNCVHVTAPMSVVVSRVMATLAEPSVRSALSHNQNV